MKPNKTKANRKNGSTTHRIRVEFTHPTATEVFIAGTFNDWRPAATPMVALDQGRWVKELVLPAGRHEYCLVVDSNWIPDPLAPETVPNPFGGRNSILKVGYE